MYRHPDGQRGTRGVWRHGDWIRLITHGGPPATLHGSIIYGRSDATINRHGIRMGTAELYRAVEAQPEVLDSLVVDLEYLGRESYMPLFVVLRDGLTCSTRRWRSPPEARRSGRGAVRAPRAQRPSSRSAAIPRTLSGKKMELPVKKLLMGADPAQVMNRDAMANADCVAWFVDLARQRAQA